MINPPKPRKTEANTDIKRFYDKRKNSSKMTKVLRFLKKPVALLIGAISGGGSIFAGLDVEFAVLVGASAFLLIAGVELETIKQWKEMMEDEKS